MITDLRDHALSRPEFEKVSDVEMFDWLVTGQAPELAFTFVTKCSNFARAWLREQTEMCLIRCYPLTTDITTPEEILMQKKQYTETYFGENLC